MASGIIEQRFGKSDIQGHGNTVKQGVFYESPYPKSGLFIVPRSANRLFTGRQDVLDKLCKQLDPDGINKEKQRQTRVAITGIGGLGKSELCLKLIDMVRDRYENIFWVDVGDYDAAEQAFMSISHRLGFQAQGPREAVQCVAGLQQTWLLVLDNADDPNKDYHPYFPAGSQGTVVITSRNPACGREYGRDCHEELKALDREQTTDLLLQAADLALSSSLRLVAGKIVETLGVWETTLSRSFSPDIAIGHCDLDEYLGVYEKNWTRVVSHTSSQDRSRYGSLLTTFEPPMSILEARVNETSADALDMLHILFALAANDVPFALFEEAWRGISLVSDEDETDNVCRLSKWHISKLPDILKTCATEWDSYRAIEACNTLKALSLIKFEGRGHARSVSMHPLIHVWTWRRQTRWRMEESWAMTGSTLSISLYSGTALQSYKSQYRRHLGAYVTAWRDNKLFPSPQLPVLRILCRYADALNELREDR